MQARFFLTRLAAATTLSFALPTVAAAQTFKSTAVNVNAQNQDMNWFVAWLHGPFNGGLPSFGGTFAPAYTAPNMSPYTISTVYGGTNGGMYNYVYMTFRQSFDLTGFDETTADLKFKWGCDDVTSTGAVAWVPAFSLNGGPLQGAGSCGAYAFGGVVDLNSGFVSGVNTIDFYVQGNGQTDGLLLQTQSFTADPAIPTTATPEPASLVLVATGLLLTAGVLRRRKR